MLRGNCNRRIVELEAQLEAIGAGGVEPLRRRQCLHQISEPTPRRTDWLEQLGFELREHGGVRIVVDDCGNEREATLTERVLWDALLEANGKKAAPAAVAVPVGATHYQPHQKAYYKRLSATEWKLWAESRKEWIPSPGTSDSAQWVTIQAIQAPQLPAAARPEQDDDADWEIRGKLAASLTCWHRLTGAEADELVGLAKSLSAPQPPAQAQEPFGYVNTHTGQFFKDVETCRKGNEGHWRTVYTNQAPQQPAQAAQGDALTIAEADQLEKVITDFDECGETDVPDTALQRFAAMGYLECVHYNVLPAAHEAIDAARAQAHAKEGASHD